MGSKHPDISAVLDGGRSAWPHSCAQSCSSKRLRAAAVQPAAGEGALTTLVLITHLLAQHLSQHLMQPCRCAIMCTACRATAPAEENAEKTMSKPPSGGVKSVPDTLTPSALAALLRDESGASSDQSKADE